MSEARKWDTLKADFIERMNGAAPYIRNGKVVAAEDITKVLEAVIRPFDRVNIEGNNQKQAEFLAECLKNATQSEFMIFTWCNRQYRWPCTSICSRWASPGSWISPSAVPWPDVWPSSSMKGRSNSAPSIPTWSSLPATSWT